MRLKTGNQTNRVMNGSRYMECNLHVPVKTGSENGHGTRHVLPSHSAVVTKGDCVGSADIWLKIPPGIVPEGAA